MGKKTLIERLEAGTARSVIYEGHVGCGVMAADLREAVSLLQSAEAEVERLKAQVSERDDILAKIASHPSPYGARIIAGDFIRAALTRKADGGKT